MKYECESNFPQDIQLYLYALLIRITDSTNMHRLMPTIDFTHRLRWLWRQCRVNSKPFLSLSESVRPSPTADGWCVGRWRHPEGGGPPWRGPTCTSKRFCTEYKSSLFLKTSAVICHIILFNHNLFSFCVFLKSITLVFWSILLNLSKLPQT